MFQQASCHLQDFFSSKAPEDGNLLPEIYGGVLKYMLYMSLFCAFVGQCHIYVKMHGVCALT
jgi:hypothetical protein